MKAILLLIFLLPALCLSQVQYSNQTAVDTVTIQASKTFLIGLIIGQVGTTDTLRLWDSAASDSASLASGGIVSTIVVSGMSRSSYFGEDGIVFKRGLSVGITGTSGKYTFIYK